MMAHGSRAGMLLARCDVIDAIVVRLAAGGDDILISGSDGLRALAEAAGIRVGLIASGAPGSPIRTVAWQSRASAIRPRRWRLSRRGRVHRASKISGANELWEPGGEPRRAGTRRRPATETAGEPRTGPRQATPGGGRSVYGMQELVGLCDYRTTSTGLSARWMTLCAVLPTSSPLRSPRPREPITMTPASCALASPMISRAA